MIGLFFVSHNDGSYFIINIFINFCVFPDVNRAKYIPLGIPEASTSILPSLLISPRAIDLGPEGVATSFLVESAMSD